MNKKNIPIVTTILIIINIAVFLVMEFTGSTENTQFLYEHGAMYWPAVLEDGQWYRLITHMFVHSGANHITNNMFMLGILGYQIEKEYGPIKYLITYFVSGIGGAVLSALIEMSLGEAVVSVGASGNIWNIRSYACYDFQKQTKNGTGICTTTYYFICFDGIWKYGRRCGCNGASWRSINWCGNGIFAISH